MNTSEITLLQSFNKTVTVNPEDHNSILGFFQKTNLRKKDYLLKAPTICKSLYFVSQGCLRLFFVRENGDEKTTYFATEQWWMADFLSFTLNQPSSFFIQAVENTEVYELTKDNQEALLKAFPYLERYFRLNLQRAYGAAQYRLLYQYSFSKEESYLHFKSLYPEFVQRVPQYMLASFLGFTPEYLSELRKKNV
ncbi:Crp/Fnr family transcriptional regulator [Flavobacterium sp. HSC-61S13]|uniref:Crp/Fnr family transcriptional regulator n=1 Tax=Flavobacterium sp. HSC-61S13 TaxID=2910963 RepID=UPI00209E9057|nr:Crp/Fnr family transcriptional regulator [Flavobacterium sp. HSC-61S13]MCP1995888.1 CRP-like cAMP-binding protein [Flavobacterium sp. HSC-61S13]